MVSPEVSGQAVGLGNLWRSLPTKLFYAFDWVTTDNEFCKKGLQHNRKLFQETQTDTSLELLFCSFVYSIQIYRSLKHEITVLSSMLHINTLWTIDMLMLVLYYKQREKGQSCTLQKYSQLWKVKNQYFF